MYKFVNGGGQVSLAKNAMTTSLLLRKEARHNLVALSSFFGGDR